LEDDLSVLEIIPSGRPVLFSMPRTEKEGSKRWFNDPLSLKQRYGNFLNIRSMGRFRASEAVYSMIVGERW
ncbi:MAG: hypothetical protein LBK52_02620, partial [Deltaproteobacteria bacterium]|nr:hypothetical protein [Deltaproteobacteria bacterium]